MFHFQCSAKKISVEFLEDPLRVCLDSGRFRLVVTTEEADAIRIALGRLLTFIVTGEQLFSYRQRLIVVTERKILIPVEAEEVRKKTVGNLWKEKISGHGVTCLVFGRDENLREFIPALQKMIELYERIHERPY